MKKFRYSLEAVRTVREHRERAAIEEYGKAAMAHRQAMAVLAQEEQRLESVRSEIRARGVSGIAGRELAHLREGYQTLEVRRRQQEQVVASTLSALTRASENCTRARREREVVEKHFQQHRARHAQKERQEELKFLDELGTRSSALQDFAMASGALHEEAVR